MTPHEPAGPDAEPEVDVVVDPDVDSHVDPEAGAAEDPGTGPSPQTGDHARPIAGRPVRGWRPELLVALAMVALSSIFVGARVAAHDGDETVFILAGDGVTDPVANPDLFVVRDADGYDGQRYFRLALNPTTSAVEEFGISFDRPAYWQRRIVYPVVVWAVSGFGHRPLVPWAMIGVNVVAVAVVAALCARLARMHGRSPWWGLVPAAWGGYVIAIGHNLTEPVVGVLFVGTLLALRRERWGVAALCLTIAALTRESSMVFTTALLAAAAFPTLRRVASARTDDGRRDPGTRVPLWVPVLPLAAYGAWRWIIGRRWADAIPGGPPGDDILGVPFYWMSRYFRQVIGDPGAASLENLFHLALVFVAFTVVILALRDRDGGLPHERLALAGMLVLFVCLPVWNRGQAYLRWSCEPIILGWLLLLANRSQRIRVLAGAVAVLWVAIVVDLVPFPDPALGVDRAAPAVSAPAGAPAATP
jgi:hypothetical protein